MSSSTDSESNKFSDRNKISSKLILKDEDELRNSDKETIINYVKRLHEFIRKNTKKKYKYKNKIKNLKKNLNENGSTGKGSEVSQNVEEPTSKDKIETTHCSRDLNEGLSPTAAFSFVDELRQVAEQAQNLNNFIYEPTSGLYYDQSSGYYYNAEYGLYYDGNTGCYYSYNKEKKAYEFHSQAGVQPSQSISGTDEKSDAFENYVNSTLLNRFRNININQMRKNALGENRIQNDDEVQFDEWGGVITDKEKLQQIKEEKSMFREVTNRKKAKNVQKNDNHKSKKVKRSRSKERNDLTHNPTGNLNNNINLNSVEPHGREEVEEGELSSSSKSDSNSGSEKNVKVYERGSRFQDIAKKYPPSLRIIVQETNLENLKVGSLSLITYKGGTLGRFGHHDVIVPDVNVSKYHLKFYYDTKLSVYKCIDLGSRNGTLLNGSRMSSSKTESDAYDLVHGSVIQIGQTKLLCHVHEGNTTCGLCEPGLLIETLRETVFTVNPPTVPLTHKEQLKKLQKKYGLENEKFIETKVNAPNYNDRAAIRRIKVGSSNDNEKTHTASVDTEISSENKGFKMLMKLGWNKGDSLGKTNAATGLLEPINVLSNTKGLGCNDAVPNISITITDKKKIENLKKTQERYKSANIFCVSDDSD